MPKKPAPAPKIRRPKLCHNKASGRAYVSHKGTRIYLGAWGTDEADEAYRRYLGECKAGGGFIPSRDARITVNEITAAYLEHAATYYRDADGNPTSELVTLRNAAARLVALYGSMAAVEVGPKRLKALRAYVIDNDDLARETANRMIGVVRRIFRWAASEELIPASVCEAQRTLAPLMPGRSHARETPGRAAVALAVVEATLPHCLPPVAAMARLQLLCGARPAEVVHLRKRDIMTDGEVWEARIDRHKLSYRGQSRVLYFGARAQEVLRPYLLRADDAYLFTPAEAIKARAAQAKTHRRETQQENPRKTDRRIGECYTPASYRRAIERAVKKANEADAEKAAEEDRKPVVLPVWSPYQLRHAAATLARREFGLDGAQSLLGHRKADTSEIYAMLDADRARSIAAAIG
jgi:integrase